MKSATPVVVEIFQGVFLCRSTGRGDRFITSSGNVVVHPWGVQDLEVSLQWLNSDLASQYECDHVKHAKNPDISGPVATYLPNISSRSSSDSVEVNLIELVS